MKLPQREFYTLQEVAARWGCTLADIAGWSTAGQLDVVTGIPPTFCGTTRVPGTVVISTMDILPMFRRTGTGPQNAHLRRLRTEEAVDWLFVTDPPEGEWRAYGHGWRVLPHDSDTDGMVVIRYRRRA